MGIARSLRSRKRSSALSAKGPGNTDGPRELRELCPGTVHQDSAAVSTTQSVLLGRYPERPLSREDRHNLDIVVGQKNSCGVPMIETEKPTEPFPAANRGVGPRVSALTGNNHKLPFPW